MLSATWLGRARWRSRLAAKAAGRLPALAALATAALNACVGYTPPRDQSPPLVREVEATGGDLFKAAVLTLVGAGYRLALTDRERGLISTNRQTLRLTAAEVDCGSSGGVPYAEDERTVTHVSVKLRVADGSLAILARIEGELAAGKLGGAAPLDCSSTGRIEAVLAGRIIDKL